jgi:hypothetical protein
VEAGRTRDARALIEAGIDLGSEDSEYQERYRRAAARLAE